MSGALLLPIQNSARNVARHTGMCRGDLSRVEGNQEVKDLSETATSLLLAFCGLMLCYWMFSEALSSLVTRSFETLTVSVSRATGR